MPALHAQLGVLPEPPANHIMEIDIWNHPHSFKSVQRNVLAHECCEYVYCLSTCPLGPDHTKQRSAVPGSNLATLLVWETVDTELSATLHRTQSYESIFLKNLEYLQISLSLSTPPPPPFLLTQAAVSHRRMNHTSSYWLWHHLFALIIMSFTAVGWVSVEHHVTNRHKGSSRTLPPTPESLAPGVVWNHEPLSRETRETRFQWKARNEYH